MVSQKQKGILGSLPILAAAFSGDKDVTVGIGGDRAYAKKGHIQLPSLPLDCDRKLEVKAFGFLSHEDGHLQETELGLRSLASTPFVANVYGAIEDVRMEHARGLRYPGGRLILSELVDLLEQEGSFGTLESIARAQPAKVLSFGILTHLRASYLGQPCGSSAALWWSRVQEMVGFAGMIKLEVLLDQVKALNTSRDALHLSEQVGAFLNNLADEPEDPGMSQGDEGEQGDEGGQDEKGKQSKGSSKKDGKKDGKRQRGSQSDDKDQSGDAARDQSQSKDGGDQGEGQNKDGDQGGESGQGSDQGDDDNQGGESGQGSSQGSDGDQDGDADQGNGQGDGDDQDGHADQGDGGGNTNGGADSNDSSDGEDGDTGSDSGEASQAGGESLGGDAKDSSSGNGTGGPDRQAIKEAVTANQSEIESADIGDITARSLEEEAGKAVEKAGSAVVRNLPSVFKNAAQAGGEEAWEVSGESKKVRTQLAALMDSQARTRVTHRRTGTRIDGNVITRAVTGSTNIFIRKDYQKKVNTAAFMLLDRSSSMDSKEKDTADKKIVIARKAALAAAMGISGIHGCKVAVAAFPGVEVLKTFDEPVRSVAGRFETGTTGTTPLGDAMLVAAQALATRREERKMLIVVTDGQPDDVSQVKELVSRFVASGIEVIGIGINDSHVKDLFPNWKVIRHVSQLAGALFTTLKEKLKRAA